MNQIYNPKNVKPPVPTDIDETDSCMERYIRQKYQHRSLEDGKPKPPSRHDSGYNRSPEGSPPPLPPKTGKFFGIGLRSASSTSNLHRFSLSKPTSPRATRHASPPPSSSTDASFESKMATLKEMGFPDERRNATVLRGLSGNMERTVDSLTRLGEGGSRPISRARTPGPTLSAAPPSTSSPPRATTSYNPFDQLDAKPVSAQPTGKSYNPFDMPTQPQQQQQQPPASAQPLETSFQNLQVTQPLFPHSTGGYPNRQNSLPQPLYQQSATPPVTAGFPQNSFVASPQSLAGGNNPFFQTSAQSQSVQSQAPSASPYASQFQNGLPSQPHSAGPFSSQFPGPQSPQSAGPFAGQPQSAGPLTSQFTGAPNNPFFSQLSTQQTSMLSSGPPQLQHANTMPSLSSPSPFGLSQPPQAQPLQPQPTSQPSNALNPYNPFQSATAQPQQPQAQQQPQQSFLQPGVQSTPPPLVPQATGRVDKSSILSLYSMPSPTPTLAQQSQLQQQQQQQQQQMAPSGPTPQPQLGLPQSQSTGMLSTGSRNPFMSSPPNSATQPDFKLQQPLQPQPQPLQTIQQQQPFQPQPQQPPSLGVMGMKTSTGPPPVSSPFGRTHTHMSQQSVDISGLQNGRHSPDAFASLSARYG